MQPATFHAIPYSISRHNAPKCETLRMNQHSYRPEKKTNARLGSCMQMEGALEFRVGRRFEMQQKNELLHTYRAESAMLFNFH